MNNKKGLRNSILLIKKIYKYTNKFRSTALCLNNRQACKISAISYIYIIYQKQ